MKFVRTGQEADMRKEKTWFQQSLHRLLVDMHIPDWDEQFLKDFSPENYADMMALAKVGTAEIYAGSCLGLCYWPTRVGFPHRQRTPSPEPPRIIR